LVATLNVTAARTAVQRPADISETLAYARNPFSFVVTLTGTDTFADLLSVRLVLREFPHPATDTPLAEVIWSSPTGTSHTFDFTDAQMNQLAGEDGTTYWAILTVIDPTDGTIVLWRGKLTLVPSYATEDTAPPPATTTKLTLAEATELYATLADLDALDVRVTALEDGGTEVWGGITGTLSNQTDLNNALSLKATLASPALTGVPTAPTAAAATNTTQIATTAFVLSNTSATWGGITGTLSSQTDLNNALALKANTASLGNAATMTVDADLATLSLPASTTISAFGATLVDDADAATARTTLGANNADNLTSGTVGISRGGTGRTTSTTAYGLLAAGTTATGPQQTLAAGLTTEILVGGGGSALPIWTSASGSGAPVRAVSPTITGTLSTGLISSSLSALGTTPTDGVLISNGSFATTGAQQYSPSLSLSGDGFSTGGGHMPVKFSQYVVPVQGSSSPTGLLRWDSSVGGAAAVTRMTLDTAGNLSPTGSVLAGDGTVSAPAYSFTSSPGVGLYYAAGIIRTTSGTVDTAQFATNMTGGVNIRTVNGIGFGATAASADAIIGRQGAANIRQGAPDAATAVAQISSVQNVVTGTSNTAGADRTYAGSQGTGSGVGGAHVFQVAPTTGGGATNVNSLAEAMRITGQGIIQFPSTVTAGGTTGNRTINKTSGTVNIAAAGTTVTVTNSLCSTTSIVLAVIRTNDTTAVIKNVVPGAGIFAINLNAAATAEISVGFILFNP
jgi:hypothetical protein